MSLKTVFVCLWENVCGLTVGYRTIGGTRDVYTDDAFYQLSNWIGLVAEQPTEKRTACVQLFAFLIAFTLQQQLFVSPLTRRVTASSLNHYINPAAFFYSVDL